MCCIFVGIPQHQKGYPVYVPYKRKIISFYDALFDDSFSSALSYTSQPYSESIAIILSVSYIPYATYSNEKNGYIITYLQFEEGGLLLGSHNGTESGDKSDDN